MSKFASKKSYIAIEKLEGDITIDASILVWKGKSTPDGEPTHSFKILENGEYKYSIGYIEKTMSKGIYSPD